MSPADPTSPLAAPRSPIQATLEDVVDVVRDLTDGAVADYIPALAEADPDRLALCVATTDGYVYAVGDADEAFTIQSISKPLTYGLVIEEHGFEAVSARVGVEPSGEAFNSISLEAESGRPRNPMINAGAITCAGLVPGRSETERVQRVLDGYAGFAGRALSIDRAVYEGEHATGHRNYAIGHLLRGAGMLDGDPEEALRVYFQQCSVAVTCRDLAVIGATLATGGVNPTTGTRVLASETTQTVLSVMTTCGMYDAAGWWVQQIGLPAKSGVAGGVMAVLPGQVGIGAWSPRLDQWGNSVRGVAACRELSRREHMHFLRAPRTARASLRAHHTLREVPSTRVRGEQERACLERVGGRGGVFSLQGDVVFSAAELVIRKLTELAGSGELEVAIIDLSQVTRLGAPTARLLRELAATLAAADVRVAFVTTDGGERLLGGRADGEPVPRLFPAIDDAAQWAEERLLDAHAGDRVRAVIEDPADHPLLAKLSDERRAMVTALLERRDFAAGEMIVEPDQLLDEIVLITAGEVSLWLDDARGHSHRILTAGSGAVYGDINVAAQAGGHGQYVTAGRSGTLYALSSSDLVALRGRDERLYGDLITATLAVSRAAVNLLSREIATLQ